MKNGPFDLDLVFVPDGIEHFEDAWRRRVVVEGFPVCHIDDIIAPIPSADSDDCELFLALFTNCQGQLRAFIRRLVHDPAQADGTFQSTSLVLSRSCVTFRHDVECEDRTVNGTSGT